MTSVLGELPGLGFGEWKRVSRSDWHQRGGYKEYPLWEGWILH